jgi:hypothetical protein
LVAAAANPLQAAMRSQASAMIGWPTAGFNSKYRGVKLANGAPNSGCGHVIASFS